jgi:hypothetical protein
MQFNSRYRSAEMAIGQANLPFPTVPMLPCKWMISALTAVLSDSIFEVAMTLLVLDKPDPLN